MFRLKVNNKREFELNYLSQSVPHSILLPVALNSPNQTDLTTTRLARLSSHPWHHLNWKYKYSCHIPEYNYTLHRQPQTHDTPYSSQKVIPKKTSVSRSSWPVTAIIILLPDQSGTSRTSSLCPPWPCPVSWHPAPKIWTHSWPMRWTLTLQLVMLPGPQ